MAVGSVALGDKDGIWLTVRNAKLDVSAMALFSRRLHIQEIEASEIDLARLPQSAGTQPKKGGGGFPSLPVTVELDRLSLPHIALGAPVLGAPALLALRAHAAIKPKSADLALGLTRGDGIAGHADIALSYDTDARSIELNADIAEPTGQLADLALHRADHLPAAVILKGGRYPGRLERQFERAAGTDDKSGGRPLDSLAW